MITDTHAPRSLGSTAKFQKIMEKNIQDVFRDNCFTTSRARHAAGRDRASAYHLASTVAAKVNSRAAVSVFRQIARYPEEFERALEAHFQPMMAHACRSFPTWQ
jgi:hypothetical protein